MGMAERNGQSRGHEERKGRGKEKRGKRRGELESGKREEDEK